MSKLSPHARAMLDLARDAHDPTPEQRVRADAAVRIGLALHGATDLPPLDPPLSVPHAAKPGSIAKLSWTSGWKLGIGAVALLAAGMLGARGMHRATPSLPAASAPSSVPAPALRGGGSVPALALRGGGSVPAPVQLTVASALPAAVVTRSELSVETAPAPIAVATVHGARHSRSLPRSSGNALIEPESGLEAEVALIGSANELIRARRYDEALRVLAGHARRFPRGALREERDALHALALCGLDSGERAERAVQRFLRSAPHSVVAERVRASCGAGASEGALQ